MPGSSEKLHSKPLKEVQRFIRRLGRRYEKKTSGLNFDRNKAKLFKKIVKDCEVYGEYGVGASTIYVGGRLKKPIIAVDTSSDWIHHVRSYLGEPAGSSWEHLVIKEIDVGDLGKWGKPVNPPSPETGKAYANALWDSLNKPDAILIDGRFRVASFAATMIHAREGAKILFDDYTRDTYQVCSSLVRSSCFVGDLALFEKPTDLSIESAKAMLDEYAADYS